MKILKFLGYLISISGSIFTILYYFTPIFTKTELQVNYLSFDRLTPQEDKLEPGLRSEYYFQNKKIFNLWKVKVEFKNAGKNTIIGEGPKRNIFEKGIILFIPKAYKILGENKVFSDFYHQLVSKESSLSISFKQWRIDEKLIYSFYIETPTPYIKYDLLLEPEYKQIIDGNIKFNIKEASEKRKFITDFVPTPIKIVSYAFFIFIFALLSLTMFFGIFLSPVFFFARRKWYRNYYEKYKEFIISQFEDEKLRALYIAKPDELPFEGWKKFEGPGLPYKNFEISGRSIKEEILTEIMIIFGFLFLAPVLMELIKNFPP